MLSGNLPDSKVHGANMGPTWVLSAPEGPHVGHMNYEVHEANMGPTWVLSAPDGPHIGPMNYDIRAYANPTHIRHCITLFQFDYHN